MSLQNLLNVGQLEEHETSAVQVCRMLESAERSIADARQKSISSETRLDAAYRAVIQLSMVALWTNGFRPANECIAAADDLLVCVTKWLADNKPELKE